MTKITTAASSVLTGAAYIRVSTDDQLEYSPESQLEEIQGYCLRNNIILSKEYIFVEEDGKSGRRSANRDAFQRMIGAAKQKPKPFDVILVWKFSRFARNQDESTFYKSMLRKKLGIDVVSISEPILDGMYGRLIEMIIEWQDEYYSVNLSNEVIRSMKSKARKGLYNGKMPLGYAKEPDKMPVIVPEEAHIVQTIFQMFTTGYDLNYVVRYLNDKGFHTKTGKKFDTDAVRYILENPFYIGKIRWNRRKSSSSSSLKDEDEWIVVDSHHEPLITLEVWEAAHHKLERIKQIYQRNSHPVSHGVHWLSGMVKCPICGKSLSFKAGHGPSRCDGFQCLGYRKGLHNESQYISEKKLVSGVKESLRSYLHSGTEDLPSFKLIRTSHTDAEIEKIIYENELKSLTGKEQRIKDAYLNEIDTLEEYKRNKALLEKRRAELHKLISELSIPSENPADYKEQFLTKIGSVLDIIESDAPYEVKGEALRGIVQKIIYHKATKTLEFHYYLMI